MPIKYIYVKIAIIYKQVKESIMKSKSASKEFAKYVSQNVFAMIGMSCYILADTFFISKAVGANGITALNLVLPLYNLIFAIGSMIGVGSAIRFAIAKNQGEKNNRYFFNAMFFTTLFALIFMAIGVFIPDKLVALLGGSSEIVKVGTPYTKIFMCFTPLFMWNYICNAFVRNDGAPSIAMAATVISSLFNIVMDWVLMFPLKMGMAGAALATALSPVVGCAICCIHFFSKKNNISFNPCVPSFVKLFNCAKLGVSAFVGEFSSGVITVAFNMIILKLVGNIGVAAYGVVANISLVAVSVFNGVAQGSQPLISKYYAKCENENVSKILKLGIITCLCIAGIIIVTVNIFAAPIANVFNSEHIAALTDYAVKGLRIYFIGFIFAGLNIFLSLAFSSMSKAAPAFIISIMRGFVVIIASVFLLSYLFKMTGVWLAFPVAEAITFIVSLSFLVGIKKKNNL